MTATDPTGVWTVTFAVSVDLLPAARIIVDPIRRAETRPVGETTATVGSSELQVTGPVPGPVDASSCCSSLTPRSSVFPAVMTTRAAIVGSAGPVASHAIITVTSAIIALTSEKTRINTPPSELRSAARLA